jgi:competence protein ComEA
MSLGSYIKKYFEQKPKLKRKEAKSSFLYFLRDYFMFHKNERQGTLTFLVVLLFITIATFSYRFRNSQATPDTSGFQKQLNEFIASAHEKEENDSARNFIEQEISSPSKPAAELFVFNPNIATEEDFIKLGLTKKQASGILNYRNKSGKFRKKEDFSKMYTISKNEYERLEAFISIPVEIKEEKIYAEKKAYNLKPKDKLTVEINTADSLELIRVPGIKGYTAMKIIELRNKLGGFYSREQLREVYRIDSARYSEIEPFIIVDQFMVKYININKATIDEMKIHPYIRYNLANVIVNYRQQHGLFTSIQDIQKIHLVDADLYRKIAPYLTVE